MMKTNNEILIYGRHPVFSVLKTQKRKIYEIFISNKNKNEFLDYIKKQNINIDYKNVFYVDNNKLNSIIRDQNHQGYVIKVGLKKNISLYDFIDNIEDKENLPKLLILDQIIDPHNLGAIIRTSYAFGIKNIIITSFNSVKDTSIVIKSSSGYSEFIDLIEVVNLNDAIKNLKKIGYFIIGMDGEAKININQITNNHNIAVVLGNEGKGIRDLVKKNCDDLIKIPMLNEVESLNVSIATAITVYEIWGKNGN